MRSSQYLYPVYSWQFPFPFFIQAHFLSPHVSTVGKITKKGEHNKKEKRRKKTKGWNNFFEGFYIHRCNSQRGWCMALSKSRHWMACCTSKQTFYILFPSKANVFFSVPFFFLSFSSDEELQKDSLRKAINSKETTSPSSSFHWSAPLRLHLLHLPRSALIHNSID